MRPIIDRMSASPPSRVCDMRDVVMRLAAAALFYQGLIPAGYMLGARSDFASGAWVVVCPAQQEAALLPAMHHHHHHHAGGDADAHHADSCAFAVAAAAVLPPAILQISILQVPPLPAAEAGPEAVFARDAHLLPPARAPPVFS